MNVAYEDFLRGEGWIGGWGIDGLVGWWVGGWLDGWLENEFQKKTPSPKFRLEPQLGTSDFGWSLSIKKIR